jgi:long-chain acyl-CoA synthetase
MNAASRPAARSYLLPRFDAAQVARQLMQSEEITFFAGVPTMYWGLLGALDRRGRRRPHRQEPAHRVAGGAALPVEITATSRSASASRSSRATASPRPRRSRASRRPEQEPRVGSIGTPIWGVEMKLINDDWTR